MESLEARELLSVTPIEPADLLAMNPEIYLPAERSELNAIELTELTNAAFSKANDLAASQANLTGSVYFNRTVDLGAYEMSVAGETTTLVVTTNLDVVDENDGVLSLREAIQYAEADASLGETITFDASLKGKTIALSGTELTITQCVTIDASTLYDAENNVPGITVNAGDKSRVFNVSGGTEEAPVELIGLTITGGTTTGYGGGVCVNLSAKGAARFEKCVFVENTAENGGGVYTAQANNATASYKACRFLNNATTSYGGGVYASTSSFVACTVAGNAATQGGGVYVYGTSTFTNTTISNNTSSSDGGGVYVYGTSTFTNTTISSNTSSSDGGGVYVYGTSTFTNTTISSNTSSSDGGVYVYGTSTFTNTTISSNTSSSDGGGVYVDGTSTFTNTTISNNTSSSDGGGVYVYGTSTFTNTTISSNTSSSDGGVYVDGTSTFTNTTISNNTSFSRGGVYIDESATFYNSIVALNTTKDYCSDIYCIWSDARAIGDCVLSSFTAWIAGGNNYVYDETLPLFTDAANGDYTLAENSQALDKGDARRVIDANDIPLFTDLAGAPRFVGTVDLGAYESQNAAPAPSAPKELIFGSYDAKTKKDETSWDDVSDEISYRVQFSYDGETWTTSQMMKQDETSRFASVPRENATYYFRVRAENAYGVSDWTESLYYRLTGPSSLISGDYNAATQEIELFWDDVSAESSYRVEISADGVVWELSQVLGQDEASCVAPSPYSSTRYFRVRAENSYGVSAWSTLEFTAPSAPVPSALWASEVFAEEFEELDFFVDEENLDALAKRLGGR